MGNQSSSQLKVGDLVRVELGERAVKALQEGHGGWNADMDHVFGDIGMIVERDGDGDVKVMYERGKIWTLNPAALTKVTNASSEAAQAQRNGILNGAMTEALTERLGQALMNLVEGGGQTEESAGDSARSIASSIGASHAVLVGCRVVRGPDWRWAEQDGGLGGVGTVVRHYLKPEEVIVQWDGGSGFNYRYWAADLRVLDSAPTGQSHLGCTCDACGEQHMAGIRWKCTECEDYDLCSFCYHKAEHNTGHAFKRRFFPNGDWVQVPPRRSSQMLSTKGCFVGAIVERGRNWKWASQDGGSRGKVVEVKNWDAEHPRSAVRVTWNAGSTNTYRLGFRGSVDVKACTTSNGPRCYLDHLPTINSALAKRPLPAAASGLEVAETVVVVNCAERLRELQTGHGGWTEEMASLAGKSGKVKAIDDDGDVVVTFDSFSSSLFYFNPVALHRCTSSAASAPGALCPGDAVRVELEEELVKAMQEGHGGWNDGMARMFRRSGKVLEIDSDGDVRVAFENGDSWFLNPACLTKVAATPANPPPAPGNRPHRTKEDFALGEWVRTCGDVSATQALQEGHGGWTSAMAASAGQVGKINDFTPTGNVRVEVGGFTWTYNPTALDKFTGAFACGERVLVCADEARVRRLQQGHGNFVEGMRPALGEEGTMTGYSLKGDIRVAVQGRNWIFAAEVLNKAVSAPIATTSPAAGSSDDVQDLRQQLDRVLDAHGCPICLSAGKSVVFLCGHGACDACADQVSECPVCRKTITQRIKLF